MSVPAPFRLTCWLSLAAAVAAVILTNSLARADEPERFSFVTWSAEAQPPDLPDPLGVAGPFVGVSNGALLVAGGANFPKGVPWRPLADGSPSPKVYYDGVYVLIREQADTSGGKAGALQYRWVQPTDHDIRLPRAIGYGVSITTPTGVICLGGEWKEPSPDDPGKLVTRYSDGAYLLSWNAAQKTIEISTRYIAPGDDPSRVADLPRLPAGCTMMSGALVGNTIYIVGGDSGSGATKHFWSLDLSKRFDKGAYQWQERDAWPGPPRVLPIVVAQNDGSADCLYVFSGRNAQPGKATEMLSDAYRYNPKRDEWSRVADIAPPGEKPRCVMAGTGVAIGNGHILIFGGADGKRFATLEQLDRDIAAAKQNNDAAKLAELTTTQQDMLDHHTGFPRDILAYHVITDTWVKAGGLPTGSPVTTTAVWWDGDIVIPTGEVRPGVRTSKILLARPAPHQGSFGVVNWSVLVVYLLALVAVGFYFTKREGTTDDFFLGGKRIPWWAAGLSIFATQLSAITYLAIPARTFGTNWVHFLYNCGILAIAPLVIYFYLPFYRKLNVTSVYEYLEQRFNLSLRLFGSLSFVVYQIGRMGIVLLLPAMALSAVTGINIFVSIAIMGVLSTLYTVLGGIEAVIWTDVIQAVVLVGGALAAVAIMASDLDGGVGEIVSVGLSHGKFDLANLTWDWTGDAIAVILIASVLNNLLPYSSDQAVVQRYMTTSTEKRAARAIWINAGMSVASSVLFFGVGTALYVFYRAHPQELVPLDKADQIFPWFISERMPAGLAGLVIAGVFAASMSSLDSSMHSISTAVSTDFVRRMGKPRSEAQMLRIARWLVIVLGIVGTASAMVMATIEIKYLWDKFLTIVGLLLGALGGLFTLGIFTRRTRSLHAWLGAAAATAMLIYVQFIGKINGLLYGAIAIVTVVAVGWVSSWVIPTSASRPLPDGLTIHDMRAKNASR